MNQTITLTEIYECLCIYDPRNPYYIKPDDPEDMIAPRSSDCSCDSCFRGKDRLAMEVLKYRRLLLEMEMYIETYLLSTSPWMEQAQDLLSKSRGLIAGERFYLAEKVPWNGKKLF